MIFNWNLFTLIVDEAIYDTLWWYDPVFELDH